MTCACHDDLSVEVIRLAGGAKGEREPPGW